MQVIVTDGRSGVGRATAAALTATGQAMGMACRSVVNSHEGSGNTNTAITRDASGAPGRAGRVPTPYIEKSSEDRTRSKIHTIMTASLNGTYPSPDEHKHRRGRRQPTEPTGRERQDDST